LPFRFCGIIDEPIDRRRVVEVINEQGNAGAYYNAQLGQIVNATQKEIDAAEQAVEAERQHAAMLGLVAQQFSELPDQMRREYGVEVEVDSSGLTIAADEAERLERELAAAALTARQEFFSSIRSGQDAFDELTEAQEKYADGLADLNEKYKNHNSKEYQDGLAALNDEFNRAKESSREWALNFVVDMAMARAAANGVITDAEFGAILQFMEGSGMVDAGMADVMQNITDAISAGDYEGAIAFWEAFTSGAAAAEAIPDEALTPEERRTLKAEDFGAIPETLPAPASTRPAADMFEAIGSVSPEEAAALKGLFGSLGTLDPEAMAAGVQFFDAITDVDATALLDAVEAVKYLVSQDGRTITMYVNTVDTGTGGSAPTTGAPTGSSPAPTTSVTPADNAPVINVYGPNYFESATDIFATLR